MNKNIINISVRKLVEFSLTEHDKKRKFGQLRLAQLGTKGHQYLQNKLLEEYNSDILKTEVPIEYKFTQKDITININGRIDALVLSTTRPTVIEIKTTDREIEDVLDDKNYSHIAQLKLYAYFYMATHNIDIVNLRLIYLKRDTYTYDFLEITENKDTLEKFFNSLIYPFYNWITRQNEWAVLRNNSIQNINFPYVEYRKGQREFAGAVFNCIKSGTRLLAQAPTGTGKTLATLFPTIKALGHGHIDKIFYLTAKTITRTVVQKSYEKMKENGLRLKTLVLTAKDKICFLPNEKCDTDTCPYYINFATKLKNAIKDIIEEDYFTRERIVETAYKHQICPFEFSMELSLFSDLIICDYNYLFDPRIALKRFFSDDNNEKYAVLVDEAHNLLPRSREMYSAQIQKNDFLSMRRKVTKNNKRLYNTLSNINTAFLKLKKIIFENKQESFLPNIKDEHTIVHSEYNDLFLKPVNDFIYACEDWFNLNIESSFKEDLMDLYFICTGYIKTSELYNDNYVSIYTKTEKNNIILKLYCVDPSPILNNRMSYSKSCILFSATLTPLDYYKEILGLYENSYKYRLPSPFPIENLKLLIESSISTRYKDRERTLSYVASLITEAITVKTGNFLIFFPSFAYMNSITELLSFDDNIHFIKQNTNMNELDREEFLSNFENYGDRTLVAFAVMGGIFGEGIDLTGEKLNGVIIVGAGLPQVCTEQAIIQEYFNKKELEELSNRTTKDENINTNLSELPLNTYQLNKGFDFAYTYPGINRVLQAAGRVIRTETDKGFVILIDDRFKTYKYKQLLDINARPQYFNYRSGIIKELL